jgi:hypothetical protein
MLAHCPQAAVDKRKTAMKSNIDDGMAALLCEFGIGIMITSAVILHLFRRLAALKGLPGFSAQTSGILNN